MKRFLLKLLVFFLVLAVITAGVNFAYMKLDRADHDNTKKFSTIPTEIKICNFGSSHGLYGFNYEDITECPCFNFALSSQVLSYDLRMFDHYRPNIADDAVVFIPVSYFSLVGLGEKTWDGFLEKNRRYYRILPKNLIKDYDLKTDIYVNYLPSLQSPEQLITVLLGKSKDTNDETWSKVAFDCDVLKDADEAYKRHIVTNKKDDNGKWIINQEEIDSLINLINACYSAGMTPILITVPYLHEYTDAIQKNEPEFLDLFHSIIDNVIEKTSAPYYDYAFDSRFQNNYAWFMNSDHLNKEGARQFTNILLKEVLHKESLK